MANVAGHHVCWHNDTDFFHRRLRESLCYRRENDHILQATLMTTSPTRTRAILLLAATLIVCYLPVIVASRSLVAPLMYPLGATPDGPYGYHGRTPLNTFNVDMATGIYGDWPINILAGKIWKSGAVPLWNPYQGLGVPILAQTAFKVLFPYQILEDIAPYRLWDFFILGRMLIAGIVLFLFLRNSRVSWFGSYIGGMSYMLSGVFTWFFHLEQFTNMAMMMPVLLWAVQRFLEEPSVKTSAVVGIAIGLTLFAGTPSIAIYLLLLTGMYLSGGIWRRWTAGNGLRTLVLATAGGLLGLAIAAPAVLPFLEYLPTAYNYRTAQAYGSASLPEWHTFLFHLFPSLSAYETSYRTLPINGIWDNLGGSVSMGVSLLVLAGIVLCVKRRTTNFLFVLFAAIGLGIIGKNMGIWPFVAIGYLPLFSMVWSQRWAGPAWTVAFSVAGACAYDLLSAKERDPQRIFSSVVKVAILTACAAGLAVLYAHRAVPSGIAGLKAIPAFATLAILLFAPHFPDARKRGILYAGIIFLDLWYAIPRGYGNIPMLWLLAAYILGLAGCALWASGRPRLASTFGLAAIAVFLITDLSSARGLPQRADPYLAPGYVRFLAGRSDQLMYRSIGTDGAAMPNTPSAFGFSDVHYINGISPVLFHEFRVQNLDDFFQFKPDSTSLWMTGVSEVYGSTSHDDFRVEKDVRARLPYYQLIGTRYIIAGPTQDINIPYHLTPRNPDYFPRIYHDEVNIFEIPGARPRIFVAPRVRVAASLNDAQRITRSLGQKILETAVVERDIVGRITPGAQGSATLITAEPSRLVASIDLRQPQLVVISDVFDPGWKAFLDGQETELFRVDGFMRGIVSPAGHHRLEMVYRPKGFSDGLAALALGLLLAAGCVVIERKFPSWHMAVPIVFLLATVGAATPYRSYTSNIAGTFAKSAASKDDRELLDRRTIVIRFLIKNLEPENLFEKKPIAYKKFVFEPKDAGKLEIVYDSDSIQKRAALRLISPESIGSERQAYARVVKEFFDHDYAGWHVRLQWLVPHLAINGLERMLHISGFPGKVVVFLLTVSGERPPTVRIVLLNRIVGQSISLFPAEDANRDALNEDVFLPVPGTSQWMPGTPDQTPESSPL